MRVRDVVLLGGSLVLIGGAVALAFGAPKVDAEAKKPLDIQTWRAKQEEKLKAPDGWLSVAGLFFLKPGVNTIGADPTSDIVLPADAAPAKVGRLQLDGDRAWFEPEPGADVKIKDQAVTGRIELDGAAARPPLGSAARAQTPPKPPTRLTIGRLTLHLHRSGDRLAVRLRDPESKIRREFTGLKWFPDDPKWKVTGTFVPFAQPKKVTIQNVIGDALELESPGEVTATIAGKPVRLLPVTEDDQLWFVFTDATAPKETYRIRFLYADAPKSASGTQTVTLDFNRAYNPPCAYNPFTTCPLPPSQNKLTVRVPAGERAYHVEHGTR